ncbi:hypothetical protein [Paenibacillus sp. LjRoot153]|uniref:hypothetical protein n=1 Tax=Paenibacillus sp. LjRoot153 TaxID=3342270 RepID=UPI003F505FD5
MRTQLAERSDRLLRTEAESEEEHGMLMVGNAGVNRVQVHPFVKNTFKKKAFGLKARGGKYYYVE